MKKISLSEQKKIELDILKYVHNICKKNEINYSLCGGTLLGAVRHKGFIPWDDDIDIFLPRMEYERLIKLLECDNRYLIISPNTEGYFHVFSKIVDNRTIMKNDNPAEQEIPNLGVFIDIFPIDGLPNNFEEQNKFAASIRILKDNIGFALPTAYYYSDHKLRRIIKKMIYFPKHLFIRSLASPKKWKMKLLKTMQKYDFNQSEYAGFILSAYGIKEILPKVAYSGKVELEFEGEKFYAFTGYELYLKSLYGNYMELPPIEKQVSHHQYTPYWKE